MNRQIEKVKDLIEVRSYGSLVDFHADSAITLKGYHFTDITSQLMVTWLDALSVVSAGGKNARAIAGYRGVGKSHFLSTLAAILSMPELRSEVTDAHVASSVNHLMRRKYPVAFVLRGSDSTILEELKQAIAIALGADVSSLPDDLGQLLQYASDQSADVPFVILVDTAFGRETRVSRDDGVFLGELASVASNFNIFVGVALDDDITGADGINAAIAQTFAIDYLDQEHLYRIVDSHIFIKHRQAMPQIQEIYREFRQDLPSFTWSEQRFVSLYPLHPIILEIASAIRFYAQDFALLGFASDAGKKILGRPANSLIALDEVFDAVEPTLRNAEDLKETFEVYDAINDNAITNLPVMKRLQAKLILKALFVLSLDGNGTTTQQISAAMLIYKQNDPAHSQAVVEEVLTSFAEHYPDGLNRVTEGEDVKYSFKVSGKDDLHSILAEKVERVDNGVVPEILNKTAADKYADWNLALNQDGVSESWTEVQVNWRGSVRRVRLIWAWGNTAITSQTDPDVIRILVCEPGKEPELSTIGENGFLWQPAELTKEESETIRRYHILLNDEPLQDEFREQVRAAGHTHAVSITKIWDRIFLEQGKLIGQLEVIEIGAHEETQHSLGATLSTVLAPSFETKFVEHPVFSRELDQRAVNTIVADLFSGARSSNPEAQDFAREFALPLGLVEDEDGELVLCGDETISRSSYVQHVDALLEESDDLLPIEKTSVALSAIPYGLVSEARQLILAAIVASRKAEFVTAKGNRINRRSLDLAIIWDDIAGLAKPAELLHSDEKLVEWATALTRLENIDKLETSAEQEQVGNALKQWLGDWKEADIVRRFAALPDELLNTKIWQESVHVERSFGDVADTISSFEKETIDLGDCLRRIATCFNDSIPEFREREQELVGLISFIKSASMRQEIWGYLAVCEITDNSEVEALRRQMLTLLDEGFRKPTATTNQKIAEIWKQFHGQFLEHFAQKHDAIMKSHQLQEQFEELTKSDEWWEFERLSGMSIFQDVHWKEAKKILSLLRQLDCSFDVRNHLKNNPFCACSFNLSQKQEWERLPDKLEQLVNTALMSYRRTLSSLRSELLEGIGTLSFGEKDEDLKVALKILRMRLEKDSLEDRFSIEELTILSKLVSNEKQSRVVSVRMPADSGMSTASDIRARLETWVDELPADPVMLKVEGEKL